MARRKRNIGMVLASIALFGASGALTACSSSEESTDTVASVESVVETTADTTPETTTAATTSAPETVATTVASSTESTTELNLAGGNDPEDSLMPNVVCMNLQEAQDEIQDHGVFFSRSVDATGKDRMQIMDSNWIVVGQTPAPGAEIGEGDAVLSVVKIGEPTGGVC